MGEGVLIEDVLKKKKEFYELIDQGQRIDSEIVAKVVSSILLKLNVMLEEADNKSRKSTLPYKLVRLINKNQNYYRAKIILDEIERKYNGEDSIDFATLFCLEARHYLELLAGRGLVNRLDELAYSYRMMDYYDLAEFLYQTLLKYDQIRKSLAYIGLGDLYYKQANGLIKNGDENSKEEAKDFWQQAINYYKKAIDANDSDEVPSEVAKGISYGKLAEAYQQLEDYDLAIDACQEAISWDEDNYYAYKVLNTIYNSSPERFNEEFGEENLSSDLIQTKFNRMLNNFWTNSLLAESQDKLNKAKIFWKYLVEFDTTYSLEAKEKLNYYCNT